MNEIKEKYDITLNIQKEYISFQEFYNDNKNDIFKSFLKLFYLMEKKYDKNEFTLCINWKIINSDISTEYVYDRSSIDMLKDILLLYFEEIEEYEICSEILILYNQLKNVKN